MVQITKTMLPKHEETLSPFVRDFVRDASTAALPLLPQELAKFPSRWPFTRGDLYHWIPLLNKFDTVLESFCKTYGLREGPQIQDFTCQLLENCEPSEGSVFPSYPEDGDRVLIESILGFSKMLLENCGNRSIYASSPYLSDLLNSTSLSLVASTLQIGTQLAQRYQASFKRMGSTHRHANAALLQNHYNINLDRVQQLSLPFVHTTISSEPVVPTTPATPVTPSVKGKDKAYFSIPASANKPAVSTHYANDLVSLVRGKQSSTAVSTTEKPEVDWSEWGEVRITYYETSTGTQGEAGSSAIQNTINFSPQAPATPTPLRRTSNLGQSSSQRSNRVTSSEDSPTILTRSPTMHAEDTQSQSTLKVLEISKAQIASSSVHQILKENVPKVPAEMKYELLSRLRVAKAFSSSLETRQEVLAVRILAITNLAYIHTESVFLEKVLKQDSEEPRRLQVVYQLAELIHPPADPDSGISRSLQTIALSGLEALAQHSLRFIDICTALNTNVTHGVLLYIVRKAVAEMATDEPGDHRTEKDEWRDALFSLLSHVATLNRAGNELVAAGLVPILLEVLTLRTSIAERNYQKVINFVDAVLYNVRDAFQILVSSSGLEAISDLVVFQTKSASEYASGQRGLESKYRSPAIDYEISYLQQQSIKWLFKFCHHVMSSSSPYGINFDRLMRHLIDSSQFLNSLREVISHARVFGSAVWTNAVAILNDFINNEPTSFSIIAEAGLSRAFLEAVTGKEIKMLDELKDVHTQPDHLDEDGHPVEGDDESIGSAMVEDETHPSTSEVLQAVRDWTLASGILPSSEAIHIIPQTFGAICLNSSGMRMFQASNALASFFEIFESPEHVKCMHSDPSLAANLGSTFDELARHHPPLKTAIMHATFDMLARVGHLCKSNDSSKSGAHLWTTNAAGSLVPVNDSLLAKTSDLVVGSSKGKEKAIGEDSDIEMGGMSSETTSNEAAMDKKTSTAACIFATSSFLSTVFSNHGIRVMIVERGGIEYILDLAELTCLPENSSEDRSRDMLHKVIAMLSEQKPHLVMPSLLKRTQAALDDLAPFAQYREDTPYFSKFIQTTGSSPEDPASLKMFVDDARLLKSLINVQSLTTALEKCFGMANYERRHTSNSFYLTNLADYYVSLVRGLGPLLGAATREDSMLQRSVPLRWKRATRVKDSFGVDSLMMEELMGIEPETTTTTAASDEESTAATAVASNSLQVTKPEQESAPFKNFQALRIQLSKIVRTVNPLFQALGKALVPKRNPEAYQKQSHVQIADAIADVVLQQLVPFGAESSLENFNYWIVLLHTVEDILVYASRHTERQLECVTIVLQAFKEHNGFTTLNQILDTYTKEILDSQVPQAGPPSADVTQSLKLDVATQGVKHILGLYLKIVNGKNISESSQTATIASRSDRDRRSRDFFSPGQFIVEIRMAVLPIVRKLWESDIVDKGSSQISNRLIDIIRTIALADHEQHACRRTEKVPVPGKARRKYWKPVADALTRLADAGFSDDLAKEALYRCSNNLAFATEYCKAQTADRSPGRNPIPVGDLDTSPDANTSTRQQADQSTTVATPDRNSMVVDDVIAEASTNSQGMPPPPRPANLLDDPMTESLDSLLSGLSRSLQTPQTGASSSASAASQTHATPPSPSQQSILTDAGSDPNIITIEDLNEERTAIRGPLIDRCLDVINAHGEVTFEVSDLIGTVVNKSPDPAAMRNEMAQTLVNALISFGMEEDIRPAGKKIAAYAHLLALMLQDKTFFAACIPELKENLDGILGFVKLGPVNSTEESSPWIAHILLIVEVLLSEDSQPQETKWKTPMTETETIDQPVLKIEEPVVSAEARTTLLDSILDILTRVGKDESVALAVLRILVILTRTRSIAHSMGEKKNIQRLFVMAKQLAGHATVRLQSPLMLILRHIVEDDETIKQIMRSDIKAFFDAPRTHRNVDMKSYLLSCSGLAIRAPELFVEVSNEMVKLVKWTPIAAESAGRQIIELQDKYSRRSRSVPGSMVLPAVRTTEVLSLEDIKPSTEAVEGENSEKPKPTHPELKAPVVENPDGVIHFLLSELMNYRDVDDKDSTALSMDKKAPEITSAASDVPMPDATATATATSSGDDASPPLAIKDAKKLKIEFKAEEHPIYMYRCFLLQCLTELLSCYNRTKIEFINFKRSAPPQAMTPSKPRSSVVNYLLSDLIPVGTLDHNDSTNLRKKLTTSSWADSVITALLSKTGEQIVDRNSDPSDLDDEPDLYYVRRFVLENVLKAYQSASSSTESLDIKYARMLSLADLMSHIMAGKDNHGGPDPQVQSRSAQQLKRIMFEKGFIAALTGSIADIDLNFPGAKRAVKYILRPLKVLTQTAIDLSDEGKITAASGQGDEDEIESATSVSEVEDDREETPDLFRNSTLGMFEPGRDEETDSESEDDDEEMYDEGYEDEGMEEYEEDLGEDDEDNISEEDEELEGMGEIEGMPGDAVNVEVIMDDDDDDDEDEESGEDDEDEDSEDMDDMDEDMDDDMHHHGHGHVEIVDVDEDGNVLETNGDEEDDWQSDEEEDYEGMAGNEEEEELHGHHLDHITHGPLGHIVRALGNDNHENAIEILQRIDAAEGMEAGPMELEGFMQDPQDEEEDEEDEEDMEEDEGMYDDYPALPGMPLGSLPGMPVGWDEEMTHLGQPILLSRGGQRIRHAIGIPEGAPVFTGPLGGMSDPIEQPQLPALEGLRIVRSQLSHLQNLISAFNSSNNRTNPPAVPDYRGSYRLHRPGPTPRGNDDGTNPLLHRSNNNNLGSSGRHSGNSHFRSNLLDIGLGRGSPFGETAAFLHDMISSLPMPGTIARNGHALHFHVTEGPRGEITRDIQAMFGMGRPYLADNRRREPVVDPSNAAPFAPQSTHTRWVEEAKLLFGSAHGEKALRVLTAVMAVIVPPAIQVEIELKRIAEEAHKKREQERLAKEKQEAEEKAEREKKEAEELEAAERAKAEAAALEGAMETDNTDAPEVPEGASGLSMEGVEATDGNSTGDEDDTPAGDRPRVTMTIRGREIDITDLGIDAEFLAELPEDIREEVITSAIAERRSQAAASGAQPSDIDQEFLDALPAEIREEIIQQERQDRRRREREEQRRQAAQTGVQPPPAVPQEMDPASILATLPADLRRQILMEQDDDMLALLPPEYAAEARARRPDHPLQQYMRQGSGRPRTSGPAAGQEQAVQKPVRRSIVQMLDKSGVATLLRLMFVFQHGSFRTTLFQVLQNVSENRHNRAEVISTLLHILQDGSADMTAVERSFAHLSLRAKQPKEKEPKTPQPLKRTLTGGPSLTAVTSSEVSPLLVVQQCLSALVYLCQINLHVPSFFLTEHESGSGLKRSVSRKGKAKDLKAAKYALNSLLSLLDRKLIMESSSVMESLSDLLSRVTAPLQALERKQKEAEGAKAAAVKAADAPAALTSDTAELVTSPETTSTVEHVAESVDTISSTGAAPVETSSFAIVGSSDVPATTRELSETATETKEKEPKKQKPFIAPVVPEANLQLVINIFVARECSAKTFRETLSTIKNLSCIPGAKEIFGRELIRKAQELAEVILVDLDQLLPQIQKASTGTEIQGVALANFSPSGSDQNKLLRVLTALDHLFDPKHGSKKPATDGATDGEGSTEVQKQDLLATLYENSTFGPMWEKLSACLSAIRQREHMLNVATILLPLIESLMVVCKNTTLKENSRSQMSKEISLTSPPPESRMESLFFTFTEEHRKILNDLVRHTPKLMSGTFSLLVKNPKVLEFDNKRNYFTRSIHNRNNPTRQSYPPLQLSVRRDQVFHDSFRALYFKSGDEMKFGKLSIRFHGEEGVDAGGVTREWFQVLSRQMFDPGYALFVPVSSDRTTFHPNHLSEINPEHLTFFKFIGRVIGKALYEGRVLDCHFSRAVYKRILGKSVNVKDLESLDPDYFKSIKWMLDNDITDIITETFSVEDDRFGVMEVIDLVENGRNIPVTELNKIEYVRLMVEHKLTGSVQEQLDNFLKGFHEIIPAELVAIFNEQELELLISGLPEIDVDDWKNNTEYHQFSASSPQIQWFWRAIRSFDKEERAKMLQFVTGTSKVPLNGFKELEGMNGFSRFNIHRDYGSKDRLPSSHTCFNQLDLPEYESYDALRQQVLTAITAGSEYFGFA